VAPVTKAFVLGAGLGTRLHPLTEQLPKPLIPVFGRPLVEYAFEHLAQAGVTEFVVNTHHLHEEYERLFPDAKHGDAPITFRHEPVLLETGGGIDNVCDLLGGAPFLVYNGDILTDLPLASLIQTHANSRHLVTLALRSEGPAQHIHLDADGAVTDIRDMLGTGGEGTHQFTGIYACDPAFLSMLQHGEKHSVIPVFLELIKAGRLGGAIVDEGDWWDLGTREAYLDAHKAIVKSPFPRHLGDLAKSWQSKTSPGAEIGEGAEIDSASSVGSGATVGAGAVLENSIVWPGGTVAPGAHLHRCIVRRDQTAEDELKNTDI
jgi:mannose-1-phosphate guanylyltransferase/mannose-1-phosphate guanylyltransferase/phosphomannomutase